MVQVFKVPRGYIAQDFEARFAALYVLRATPEEAAEALEALRADWVDKFRRRQLRSAQLTSTG